MIIAACSRLRVMGYAHHLFDQMPEPNVSSWNSMFRGYADVGRYRDVIVLFGRMKMVQVASNCYTFPVVVKSCGKVNGHKEGEEVHCVVIKEGFSTNPFVGTALIGMYKARGAIGDAYMVFGEMVGRNVVAWTTMINGFILCNDIVSAHSLFDLAPERDAVLWNTLISGYIRCGNMAAARKLFDEMPDRDLVSWNTMLNGYANNGDVEACEKLFEEMPERNFFSWNGLIGGYAHNGCFCEVLVAFKRMLKEGNVLPTDTTLVTVLSSCARLGALDFGKWVHAYTDNNGFKGNVYVGNGLIDMYAKCGVIENSLEVFRGMDTRDLVTWNSMIGGLAVHGREVDALNLFCQMKDVGEQPDGITFIGILCACAHMGIVEDGFSFFQSMVNEYSISPQIEHYGCMVDLLARAGRVNEALSFVKMMPIEADAVIWGSLLGACKIDKNIGLAELILERLIELQPKNAANYVMLSNIYGGAGRWKDVARLKVEMRDAGLRKIPGHSMIEVNDVLAEFYSLDARHPEIEEIYSALRGLTNVLSLYEYVSDLLELRSGF